MVSVIVPAYNTSLYIADALESIFYQKYPNIEVIVVNDGSTDNTLDILQKYEKKIHIIDKKNEGSATARNAAIRISKGKYLAFLDSDDIWLPGKLHLQISYMENNPSIGVTYGLFEKIFETSEKRIILDDVYEKYKHLEKTDHVEPIEWWSGWVYRKMLFESLPHTITLVMQKRLVEKIGYFDKSFRRGQDYDYWIRLSRVTQFHKLNHLMAIYRLHGDNITAKCMPINSELAAVEKAINKWGYQDLEGSLIEIKLIKKRISDLHFNFAYQHYWRGDISYAKKSFLGALKYQPFKIKAAIYLILSAIRKAFSSPRT